MNCPHCHNELNVQTDPEHRDYKCVSGLKRREETKDIQDEHEYGLERFTDEADREAIMADPFKFLENQNRDAEVAEEKIPQLSDLVDRNAEVAKNDYDVSCLMRKKFRTEKKEIEDLKKEATRLNLTIPLLPSSEADAEAAKLVKLDNTRIITSHNNYRRTERLKMRSDSIFGTPSGKKAALEKCLRQGIEPKVFGLSSSSTTKNLQVQKMKARSSGVGTLGSGSGGQTKKSSKIASFGKISTRHSM